MSPNSDWPSLGNGSSAKARSPNHEVVDLSYAKRTLALSRDGIHRTSGKLSLELQFHLHTCSNPPSTILYYCTSDCEGINTSTRTTVYDVSILDLCTFLHMVLKHQPCLHVCREASNIQTSPVYTPSLHCISGTQLGE